MNEASPRQLEVCKRIASRTGHTFALPLSSREAHRIISKDKAIRERRRARARARAPAG